MSYDIYIAKQEFNYTSNVSALFYDHIEDNGQGGGLNELYGKKGREAGRIIAAALENIEATRRSMWDHGEVGEKSFLDKYDGKNGWGSVMGATLMLSRLMAACFMHPRNKVFVSS